MGQLATASPPTDPAPPARSRIAPSGVATLCGTVLLLSFPLLVTALIVPKFEEIFKDFGIDLPALSRMFMRVGHTLSTPMGLAGVALVVLAIVVPLSVAANRRPALAAILLLIALAITISYIVLFALGMFIPLSMLIESLQRGKP